MNTGIEQIKKIREETGASVVGVKKLLDELSKGPQKKYSPEIVKLALEQLKKEGFEKTAKRADRVTGEGRVVAYTHHTGKVACLVELLSETDFVARNELFTELAKNIALQVVSMNPKDSEELLKQEFIKEPGKTISDLVKEVIAKTGENIQIGRFTRLEIGK